MQKGFPLKANTFPSSVINLNYGPLYCKQFSFVCRQSAPVTCMRLCVMWIWFHILVIIHLRIPLSPSLHLSYGGLHWYTFMWLANWSFRHCLHWHSYKSRNGISKYQESGRSCENYWPSSCTSEWQIICNAWYVRWLVESCITRSNTFLLLLIALVSGRVHSIAVDADAAAAAATWTFFSCNRNANAAHVSQLQWVSWFHIFFLNSHPAFTCYRRRPLQMKSEQNVGIKHKIENPQNMGDGRA